MSRAEEVDDDHDEEEEGADQGASSLMGSMAARQHIFPMLVSELIKEDIIAAATGSLLLSLFRSRHPEIMAALDVYDANSDMALLVFSLQVHLLNSSLVDITLLKIVCPRVENRRRKGVSVGV